MNAPVPTTLFALLRRGAAGAALAALVVGCSGSHGASDSGTAAPDAAASAAAGSSASSAPDATTSTAPDATAGGAAGGGGGGGRAGGRRLMARALASVGLSDDQKAQIRAIMKAARTESADADPATKRANYRAAFQKVQAVLTPDQQVAFKAKMAELRAQAAQSPSQ